MRVIQEQIRTEHMYDDTLMWTSVNDLAYSAPEPFPADSGEHGTAPGPFVVEKSLRSNPRIVAGIRLPALLVLFLNPEHTCTA